jgi:hypothetical protein
MKTNDDTKELRLTTLVPPSSCPFDDEPGESRDKCPMPM